MDVILIKDACPLYRNGQTDHIVAASVATAFTQACQRWQAGL